MAWQRGAHPSGSDDDEVPPSTPWRAAAPPPDPDSAAEVVVEKWDHEIPQPTRADQAAAAARRTRSRLGPATRHALSLLAFAGAVIGALAGIGVAWMHIVGDPLADAHAYYEAAARLNAGQPLYPAGIDPNSNQIYLYPPLFAVVLRPLALLPFEWFALGWELIVVASFVLLIQRLGVRRRSTWIAIGLLGVPIGWALTVAQAHVPMTLLMAIGQPWSIAAAANLKLFPALILLYWIGRRDWESAAAFLVWSALLVLAQVVLEPGGSLAYLQTFGLDQLGEPGVLRNISPFTLAPLAWLGLLFVGCAAILIAARTRWGWAVAVTVATLAPPRLLVYMLTGLLAGIREPKRAGDPDPDAPIDAAAAYRRATR